MIFDKNLVQKALKHIEAHDVKTGWSPDGHADDQDTIISLLIHDTFGGEILKTPKRRGWHFYNRINGERIDLVRSELKKSSEENSFEDLPSTPEETLDYVAQEDYSTFFVRFIRAFEESVGLKNYQTVNIIATE